MFAPESPEVLFQDFGEGQLINGKAHITLDPIFSKNICVNEKHPMRVFVTLKGDCNGVFVTNETATGFDVTELKNGTSNAKFSWFVSANRADEQYGNHTGKFQDLRFPVTNMLNENKNANSIRIKQEEEHNRKIQEEESRINMEIKRKADAERKKELEDFERENKKQQINSNHPY